MVEVIKQVEESAPVDLKADENIEVTAQADDVSHETTEAEKQEQTGAADAEGKEKKPNRVSGAERIKQLTGEKYAERARADEAIAKLKDAEAKLARYQPKRAPNVDDFSSDDDFNAARIRHEVAEKRRVEAEMDIEDARSDVDVAIQTAWSVRSDAFKKNAPDFDDVVAVLGNRIDASKAALIKESELGPEAAYYIASHPEEAQEFINATPIQAARLLGRVEAHLSRQPGKKISNAPPPVETVNGAPKIGDTDVSKLPYDQYRKVMGYD